MDLFIFLFSWLLIPILKDTYNREGFPEGDHFRFPLNILKISGNLVKPTLLDSKFRFRLTSVTRPTKAKFQF